MRLGWMGIMISALGIVGCGPDYQAICEAEAACEGGNELDIDACVATSKIEADYIDDIGCSDEYDAYFACVESFLQCREEQTGQTCMADAECGLGTCSGGQCVYKSYGPEPPDDDTCKAEIVAFGHCT